jgi:K+-sensing histidine kinase KdpD
MKHTRKQTRHSRGRPAPWVRGRSTKLRLSKAMLDRVRSNNMFSGVDAKTFAVIAPKLVVHQHKAGNLIFDESTKGRDLYLIVQGKVRIKKYAKYGLESLLSVLHEGNFFGDLSIIDGLPRSARAEAVEDCTIISLSAADFRNLIKESDAFTFNVLKNLAFRLRTMDQTFVRELERNDLQSRAKMDRLNLLVEASKVVNSTIDLDKLLLIILEAATQSIKADRGTLYLVDELTGELWSKIAKGKGMVEIRLPIGKGLAGYVAKTGETVNIVDAYRDPRFNPEIDKRSGYKTLNVLCMPMRDKEGKIVGVFQLLNKKQGSFTKDDEAFIDGLSVHAAIAVENARLALEMVRTERLSAVGRMASTIIHDIKNPMGTLRMYAQVIKKKSGNEEAAEMADEIMRQIDRLVKMTQEILDFSRGISAMKREIEPIETVLEAALKSIDPDLWKKKITLVRKFAYTGPCLLDAEKMIRVFYNLAGNAADAMTDSGTLTVTTEKKDDRLQIEFTDTGIGMPEEIRARVFEPFFTHGKKQGTGLGLAIVKKIIDDHNGSLEIDSEQNKGTTIRMFLPLRTS